MISSVTAVEQSRTSESAISTSVVRTLREANETGDIALRCP
ncbi:MAG: hypothetical protein RMZ41_004800 [Nostoc sp. DedVER02]|nr:MULTISPECIES: hypothetical protein [unclassified Nostoc]MDZ7989983.1 hypothetical protein [Nostoc sp. DedVER02]MDZ8111723.1 hypothetical protein [Nostoc sp. DedVER01b]